MVQRRPCDCCPTCGELLSDRQIRRHKQGKARPEVQASHALYGVLRKRANPEPSDPRAAKRARSEDVSPSQPPSPPSTPHQQSHDDLQHDGSTDDGLAHARRNAFLGIEEEDEDGESGSDSGVEEEELEEDDLRQWTWETLDEYCGLGASELLDEDFMREAIRLAQKGLTVEELRNVLPFVLRVEEHLSERVFEKFGRAFPDSDVDTLAENAARVAFLSGVKPVPYDCCEDSCCCYTGAWADLHECPYCSKPRYDPLGKPRKQFLYIPLIPRLVALFSNRSLCEKLLYRHHFQPSATHSTDIFDGSHYQSLLGNLVRLAGGLSPHSFFDGKNDIALGMSTDGFGPFKRRKMTTWPLLIFNYNLPPDERFHFDNILCLGTIPGPHGPKDFDSFLHPFVQEALDLAAGVKAFDAQSQEYFTLRAYLLVVFGDIPAITKVLQMVGVNGICPCRMCNIRAAQGTQNNTYYVPHNREHHFFGPDRASYDPLDLPRRTHDEMLKQAREVDNAPTQAEAKRLATQYGIRGETILSSLPSIDLSACFPYGFMHLIWENVIQTLFDLWTEDYKDFPADDLPYRLPAAVIQSLGPAAAAASDTIPSQFGPRIPNYATNKYEFKADTWSAFSQYLAPILLRGRFSEAKYYNHFIRLIALVKLCLQFEISREDIVRIRQGFAQWVKDYENLYYRNDPRFAAACTINIHALLHIADMIELLGPVWAYWEFPMERYCGRLLPAVKSKRHPFISIAKHCVDLARISQIKLTYNAQESLSLLRPRTADLRRGEFATDAYPYCVLFHPKHAPGPLPNPILNKISASLATRFEVTVAIIQRHVLPAEIRQFGKVRRIDGGDVVHARELVPLGPFRNSTRDASFVRYELLVDRHARRRNRAPEFVAETFFGQLERIFLLRLQPSEHISLTEPCDVILAAISPCKIVEFDKRIETSYYTQLAPTEVVDIAAVQAVVGRVKDGQKWGIVDRSGPLARVEFVNDGVD